MRNTAVWLLACVVVGAGGYALGYQTRGAGGADPQRRVLLEQALLEKIDGKESKVTAVELTRQPGGEDRPHRHPGPVIGYVIQGALDFEVEGQPRRTVKQGEMFFEPAGAVHKVGRSASPTEPVKFLAVLLVPKDARQLAEPAK